VEKKRSKNAKMQASQPAQPQASVPGGAKLLTLREYCEHKQVTHGALQQLLRDGVIRYANPVKRLLDPAECDQLIDAALARAGKARAAQDGDGGDLIAMSTRLTKAKTEREEAEAEIKRLKAAQLRGELVRVDDLAQPLYALGRVLRERLQSMANRLGPVLAAEPRATRCSLAIQREVAAALDEFAAEIPRTIEQVAKRGDAGEADGAA